MSSDNEILPQQAPSWGRRLAGLDGLRGTALLGILLAHVIIFLPEKDGVYTGAQVAAVGLLSHSLTFFFVLSAFLLYRPFASAIIKDRPNPPTYDFYRNRVLRVWPAYLVVLAIVGFGFGLTVVDKDAPTLEGLGRLTDPVLLITNVLLVQGYSPATAFTGLGVSWSLITEIGFYAMLPPLGYLGAQAGPPRSCVRRHHARAPPPRHRRRQPHRVTRVERLGGRASGVDLERRVRPQHDRPVRPVRCRDDRRGPPRGVRLHVGREAGPAAPDPVGDHRRVLRGRGPPRLRPDS